MLQGNDPTLPEIQRQIDALFRLDDEGAGELLLVRHAQAATRFDGETPADPMLSCEGLEQSERLAERLSSLWVQAIYSAPERRAFQTAKIVADLLQRPLDVVEGLAEVDYNRDAVEDGAGYAERFVREPRWDSLPGFESSRTFRRRVLGSIDALLAAHPARRIAVICHASAINAYLSVLLRIPGDQFFAPDHTAVSVVRHEGGSYALRSLNDTSHLSLADRMEGFAAALTARSLPLTNR